MSEVSKTHFRVVDNGLFLPIARRLAREADRVTYWSPSQRAFPTLKDQIGSGFDDIERVDNVFEDKDDVGVWVFPDIGFSGLQAELLAQDRLVWGARTADSLEIDRGLFLSALEQVGLPVPPHTVIHGMAKLKAHLYSEENKWVKMSRYRGDWETLHFRNWEMDEMELDARSVRLGPWKEEVEFYVFDEIQTHIEDGCDSWCIDGQIPSIVLHGMEAKDKAFLGTFQKFDDLPEELRHVSEAFAPILGRHDARTFFSTEVRITEDGTTYFIDPTVRAGSPPSQVMCELINNLGEVILAGAEGELVDPEPAAKFGVQVILKIGREDDCWAGVELDPKVDRWVKSANCMKIGSRIFGPPENVTGCEDWLVGIGDTVMEAIEHLQDNMKLLPDGVSFEYHALADLLKEVHEAEGAGMEWTDQPVPEPSEIIES